MRRYGPWAVVAGASEGLGAAFATELAARGLNLILAARRGDVLTALADRLPTEAVPVVADLATEAGLAAVAEAAADREVGLVVANAAYSPIGPFLSEQDALEAEYKAKGQPVPFYASDKIDRKYAAMIGRAPFNSLIDHFDHIIKVAGIDHVGIGTDFDGIPVPPAEIDSAADFPKVTAALMARGYSADDVRKVLGGNILRVFREVQADADHTEDVTIRAK